MNGAVVPSLVIVIGILLVIFHLVPALTRTRTRTIEHGAQIGETSLCMTLAVDRT